MSLLQKIKHEVKTFGLVTLYFFVCFTIVLVLKKLFLAQYEVEFYALGAAVVGALVVGKLVVVLDHTTLGSRFDEGPVLRAVIYKSVCYTLFATLVLYIEHAISERHEAGGIGAAILEVFQHRDANRFWATIICVMVSFVAYNLFHGISSHLGDGEMKKLLLGG